MPISRAPRRVDARPRSARAPRRSRRSSSAPVRCCAGSSRHAHRRWPPWPRRCARCQSASDAVVVAEALPNPGQIGHEVERRLGALLLGDGQRGGEIVGGFAIGVLGRRVAPGGAQVLDRLGRQPRGVAARVVEGELAGMGHGARDRTAPRAIRRSLPCSVRVRARPSSEYSVSCSSGCEKS